MGAAIAARLVSTGWEVTGWTRSGRVVDSVKMADDPDGAVANADVVILALFDGPACAQVLDRVRDSLRPGAIVLNTSTIAPAEAAALARQFGASYVHAPLLGSLPAAASGALEILVGADEGTLARVGPLLDALGEVRPVGDAATAAALWWPASGLPWTAGRLQPSSPSAPSPRTWHYWRPPRKARCAARPSWPTARLAPKPTSR